MAGKDRENRRQFSRLRHSIPCQLHHSGCTASGLILDVSACGLFVRTSTAIVPKDMGLDVRVVVKVEGGENFELMTRFSRLVHRQLASAARGGFGLEITSAPEEFYPLVQSHS